jgi:sphingomyelin phosphodiesterase
MSDKPELTTDNNFINNLYQEIDEVETPRKTMKVLHMSDHHLDFEYEAGTNANCDEPVCCRAFDPNPPTPEDAAGKFGSYGCDLPPITAENMYVFVRDMPKDEFPDFVLWTGDSTPHDVWNQTVEDNTRYTIEVTKYYNEHLPGLPIVPSLGNHEFYPCNLMSFDPNEPHPIFDQIGDAWSSWLDEDAMKQFKQWGYFSMMVPVEGINLKVISINSESCNSMNFYIWGQLNDPAGQIAWIEEELKDAEEKGQMVYFIAHNPPAQNECLHSWSIRFKALV